eukprot:200552-Lingulodinium_polyedra.AAC.1
MECARRAKSVHIDAVESTVRTRNGSQIARFAHSTKTGVRMECVKRAISEPLRRQTADLTA